MKHMYDFLQMEKNIQDVIIFIQKKNENVWKIF